MHLLLYLLYMWKSSLSVSSSSQSFLADKHPQSLHDTKTHGSQDFSEPERAAETQTGE
jgi:hypothetical protein